MFCRPCGRDHSGPRVCPINERGEPSPPSVLIPAAQLAGYGGMTMTSTTASGTSLNALISWVVPPLRPPDDDGVPALVR